MICHNGGAPHHPSPGTGSRRPWSRWGASVALVIVPDPAVLPTSLSRFPGSTWSLSLEILCGPRSPRLYARCADRKPCRLPNQTLCGHIAHYASILKSRAPETCAMHISRTCERTVYPPGMGTTARLSILISADQRPYRQVHIPRDRSTHLSAWSPETSAIRRVYAILTLLPAL